MTSMKTNFRVSSKIEAFYTGGRISLSNDGQYLFCPFGNDVNVLDTQTGRVAHTLKQEEGGEVTCLAVAPDDEILVVAYSGLLLKQWNWKEETCQRTWKAIHIAPILSMAFDSTSTLLATGSSDSTIKVWDIIKQYCTHNLKGSQVVVNLLEFHPDPLKLLLFSASADNVIRVWNLTTGKCERLLAKHYSAVTSISFNDDASLLFSAGRDSIVTIWDLADYSAQRTIPVFEPLEALLVLPKDRSFPEFSIESSGDYIVTCGGQGALKVWDVVSGRHLFTQPADLLEATKSNTFKEGETRVGQAIMCAALSAIVVATHDHNIVFFSVDDFKITKQLVGNNDEILDVKFLGADETHLAVASNSDQMKVFELATLNCQILTGHTDIIVAIDVFKKGSLLVSSSKDNSVRLWQMDPEDSTVHCIAVGRGHTHSVLSVTAARLSRKFFVSGGEDLTFKVWKIPAELRKQTSSDEVTTLSVSYTAKAHDKSINSLAISPNDKLLATGSQDKTAKLWHLEQEAFLGSFRGHKRGIWCVQFSPTDQALATSSADGSIKIWSITDFSCVKTFEGHDASVLKVSFLSRGMQLLSSGSDGLLKLWTIKNNECIKTFDDHEQKVWALTPNKMESSVVTAGADSTIMMWEDITEIEYQEKKERDEQLIIREQQLSNLLQDKKFVRALGLAITLNKPFMVLNIIKTILDEAEGDGLLTKTIEKLNEEQIGLLLGFIQTWNINAKHCHYAQLLLSVILKSCSTMDVMTSPNAKELIEGLLPYSERHYQRMGRLLQQAMFVEYTWQLMRRATSSGSEDIPAMNAPNMDGIHGPTALGETRQNTTVSVDNDDSSSSEEEDEMDPTRGTTGIQKRVTRGSSEEVDKMESTRGTTGLQKEETRSSMDVDRGHSSDGESGMESEPEELEEPKDVVKKRKKMDKNNDEDELISRNQETVRNKLRKSRTLLRTRKSTRHEGLDKNDDTGEREQQDMQTAEAATTVKKSGNSLRKSSTLLRTRKSTRHEGVEKKDNDDIGEREQQDMDSDEETTSVKRTPKEAAIVRRANLRKAKQLLRKRSLSADRTRRERTRSAKLKTR